MSPMGKPCGIFCRACPICKPGEVVSEREVIPVEPPPKRPKPKRGKR